MTAPLRLLTAEEKVDNDAWIESGRGFSPFDNDALSRYFTRTHDLSHPERVRIVAAFEAAIDAGYRPKLAVRLALEEGRAS